MRWGTDLYDRFLLPWYVRSDIHAVVDDLRPPRASTFEAGWLEPFLEFRFPLVGETVVADVRLELRRAIEPWHVLGEEVSGSGTSRYVDSSVERLQLRVDGFDRQRHIITCNGVPVPLQPTEQSGTSVAGIRFKAWAPWSALHPTIDAQGPLVFDVIDRWTGAVARGLHVRGRRTRVAGATTRSRSTPPRPRPGGPAGSSRSGTPPGHVDVARLDDHRCDRRPGSTRARSTCGGTRSTRL